MEFWPPELLLKVFEFLKIDDLFTCQLVCARWRDVVHYSTVLWRQALVQLERNRSGRICYEIRSTLSSSSDSPAFFRQFALRLRAKIASTSARNWASKRPVRQAVRDLGTSKCLGIAVDFTRQLCALKVAEHSPVDGPPSPSSILVCRLGDLSELTRFSCHPLAVLVGLSDNLLLVRNRAASVVILDWTSAPASGETEPGVMAVIDVSGYDVIRCCGPHVLALFGDFTLKAYLLPQQRGRDVTPRSTVITPIEIPLPAFGKVVGFWAITAKADKSTVRVLTAANDSEGSKFKIETLTLDGRHPSREESVDLTEWFVDVQNRPKIEQRLLVINKNHKKRYRIAVDLRRFPTTDYHVLANGLRPLRNQSRRWLFLFDMQTSSLELRDASEGTVIVSALTGGGEVYESGDGVRSFVDMDAANYFDADDFSVVVSSFRDDLNVVEVLDFY